MRKKKLCLIILYKCFYFLKKVKIVCDFKQLNLNGLLCCFCYGSESKIWFCRISYSKISHNQYTFEWLWVCIIFFLSSVSWTILSDKHIWFIFTPPGDKRISAGAVIGIVASVFCVIFLIIGILWWKGCFRKKNSMYEGAG